MRTISMLAEAGIRLFSSSYSCWEILCHMEEPCSFDPRKADLQKLKYTTVLDDPEFSSRQAIRPATTSYVGDAELVRHCVACLESVDSIETFYSSSFTDSLGLKRQVSGVAGRASEILKKFETEYSNLLAKIITRLQELSVAPDDTQEHVRLIFSFLKGELSKYTDPEDPDPETWSKVREHYLVFYGYTFYRALSYASKNSRIDPNDFEDANICKHISPHHPFKMVTCDKDMRAALEKLHAALRGMPSLGIESQIAVYEPMDLQRTFLGE